MTLRENTTLVNLKSLVTGMFVNRRRERDVAARYVRDLQIKTPSIEQVVRNLSAGNQQKVVLGKWLLRRPRILFMNEPTRGIDVGAKAEIHRLIGELTRQGMAVVMVSSELSEILGLCWVRLFLPQ